MTTELSQPTIYPITPDNNPEIWALVQPCLSAHADHLERVHDGYCYLCQVWLDYHNLPK